MTKSEINVAIAKLCGIQVEHFRYIVPGHDNSRIWKEFKTKEDAIKQRPKEWGIEHGLFSEVEPFDRISRIPDYYGSLDAMHEAEMWLRGTNEQQCNDVTMNRRWRHYQYSVFHSFGPCATSRQRAELFLELAAYWIEPITGGKP